MTPAALWLVAGLVLCGAEMVVPGAFLLWIGLAALLTGGLTLLGLPPHWQLGTFAAAALALVALIALRLRRPRTPDRVNAPAEGLVGRTCHAVSFSGGEGRVALGDGQWQARLSSPPAPVVPVIAPGQPLRVTGLDGTVLLVEPA